MSALRLFTSESVTEGHPDKICDQISDSILDALLAVDPHSRVAVETLVTTGLVHVAGEVTTTGYVEIPAIVRERDHRHRLQLVRRLVRRPLVRRVACRSAASRPTSRRASTTPSSRASERATTPLDQQGAGDQGIMFGYATTETPAAHAAADLARAPLAERLAEVRKHGRARLPPPRRQDPGDRRLRRRTCRAPSRPSCCRRSTRRDVSTEQLRAEVEELVIRPGARHRRARPARRCACSSTRPAASRSAARRATPASPAARSSSTPTAARAGTAAARSAARTRRRSTARPRTRCAGSRRTPSPPGSPTASRCRSPTRSARPHPVGLYVETFGTGARARRAHHRRDPRGVRPAPGGDHPRPRPAAPDLRADGRPTVTSAASCPTSPGSALDRVDDLRAAAGL